MIGWLAGWLALVNPYYYLVIETDLLQVNRGSSVYTTNPSMKDLDCSWLSYIHSY